MSLESQKPNVENEDIVKRIESKYDLFSYSPEEIEKFKAWQNGIPTNSLEQPIRINSMNECLELLPPVVNPTTEKVNLFFRKEDLSDNDLSFLLMEAGDCNLEFEISVIRHDNNIFSIGIGNAVCNASTILDGRYFGHYHPSKYKWENAENLPMTFVKGLLPSSGDVRGYHKFLNTIQEGTMISSKFGSVLIRPIEGFKLSESEINNYKQKYFKLFLGENNFGWKSVEDIIVYFREKLGLELSFSFKEIKE